jgi:hypothetical protein
MATVQSNAKTRSNRNRPAGGRPKAKTSASPKTRSKATSRSAPEADSRPDEEQEGTLQDLIEEERGRLQSKRLPKAH